MNLLTRIKETLSERRTDISSWLAATSPSIRAWRVGPSGDQAIGEHLRSIDSALRKADSSTLGLCTVCHEPVEEELLESDYEATVCIEHLTGAERTNLENDLELSRKVQKALLPGSAPHIHGLETAEFSQPAQIVGGDYYDFLRFRDGSHGFVIADVMGKGMAASLLMASIQASLRIIAPESGDPAKAMGRLNRLFRNNIRLTRFVTVFLAQYDEATGNLTYCNAGHNPPILLRAAGNVEHLRPTGAAIGLVEQTTFSSARSLLRSGDMLLAYTDGVVEARNPEREEFGMVRVEEFLKKNSSDPLRKIIDGLRKQIQAFTGTPIPSDDTTIIAVRVAQSALLS